MNESLLKKAFIDLANEMEKNCENWNTQPILKKDQSLTEKIMSIILERENPKDSP